MATLPRVLEMGQLGVDQYRRAQSGVFGHQVCLTDLGPPDCPDTSLQYRSRHWTTSFRLLPILRRLAQILCLSTIITQGLCPIGGQ